MRNEAGYVDLQLNGYKGVDFNADYLSAEACHEACAQLMRDGVAGVLATIVTDAPDRMAARLARLAAIRRQDELVARVFWGVHIEGPFLNASSGYVGAHPVEHVRPADVDILARLLEAAAGLTRIVTLAPEVDEGMKVVRFLAERGIVASAGHSNASLDQLRAAIDAGLSMFTHLGNGCPMWLHRHDNIIQRVLSLAPRLWISLIGDGVHVTPPALGNYLRAAGIERSIIVSDGISAAGLGPGRYAIGSQTVDVGEDLVAQAADRSHFVGATATMPQIAQRLKQGLGLSDEAIHQLLYVNPCRVLGVATEGESQGVNGSASVS
ncbi:MAG: N-acetylglucosamine-6-phosphate deacetylase [Thermoguttaceae bacterium]